MYRRELPKTVSRFLELTVFGRRFDGPVPLLVLGDLPIRCRARQTVFVQTPLLTETGTVQRGVRSAKYLIARSLFRMNLRYASDFIVQTDVMKTALQATYPEIKGKVSVIPQPVPTWLHGARGTRTARRADAASRLRLIYPAGVYPHKNHKLLARIAPHTADEWPVECLTLTIPANLHPNPRVPWLKCVGVLQPAGILRLYSEADALVFLSTQESYGFPLVEAMWVGMPIVCPDLPYARTICGKQAIYFECGCVESLKAAVNELHARLAARWWPSWDDRLKSLPSTWEEVAAAMLRVAVGGP
jgi:glycosyltransferase involved in cell wall biosynthesis